MDPTGVLSHQMFINFWVLQLTVAHPGVLVRGQFHRIRRFLSGRMSSRPLTLPEKHLANNVVMGLNP